MSQMEHDRRIDYIEFPATNIPGTKAFYSGVFGWTFTDYGPDYTSFNDGRLGGGFTTDAKVAAAGCSSCLCARPGNDQGKRREARRTDHQGDIRVSRREAVSLRRSQWQRAGGVVGTVKSARVLTIDEYLAPLSDDKRAALQKLRRAIRAAAPDAEECISYGIPAVRLGGKILVWFGAATNHCSFYPGAFPHHRSQEGARGLQDQQGDDTFYPGSSLARPPRAQAGENSNCGARPSVTLVRSASE